jgi:hypothetical protein
VFGSRFVWRAHHDACSRENRHLQQGAESLSLLSILAVRVALGPELYWPFAPVAALFAHNLAWMTDVSSSPLRDLLSL